jgi:membrane fusion protein (multidrug efflux system)
VAGSREESQAVITDERDTVREPFPEEVEDRSKSAKAKGFFREHPKAKWALLFFLVVAVIVGIFLWRYYSTRESSDDAQLDAHINPVSTRVSGTVTAVMFEENDHVRQGQLLAQLDPKDYEIALQRAMAELKDAQASARAASTGVPITSTTSTSSVATARAN